MLSRNKTPIYRFHKFLMTPLNAKNKWLVFSCTVPRKWQWLALTASTNHSLWRRIAKLLHVKNCIRNTTSKGERERKLYRKSSIYRIKVTLEIIILNKMGITTIKVSYMVFNSLDLLQYVLLSYVNHYN